MPPIDTPTAIPITAPVPIDFLTINLFGGIMIGGGEEGGLGGVLGVTGGFG